MNRFLQGRGWLFSLAVASMLVSSAAAQNVTNLVRHGGPAAAPAALMPPPSPMDYFRRLLAASPQQRQILLAKKSPEVRARLMAKVNEYAALDPRQADLRLRATELQLYLTPLLSASPADRDAELAGVPEDIRDVVKSRLMQWEILPPSLQKEFLDNEHILGYFSGVNSANGLSGASAPSDAERSRWDALPKGERDVMIGQFNQFFALPSLERQKALGGLSGAERAQMEKAMLLFSNLPAPQRIECMQAYTKFAGMTPGERAEFLKNARRWSQMSVAERKAWIDLAAHVPQWPPAPAMIMPPMPSAPPARPNFQSVAATNHG